MNKTTSPMKMAVVLTLGIIIILTLLILLKNYSTTPEAVVFDEQPPISGQPLLGNVDAPVSVVEFGDFKCPSCKAWGEAVLPLLEEEYINNGSVNFSYVNVLFHGEESEIGSLAAESVLKQSPSDYWTFHKQLFEAQPESQNHDNLWLTIDAVVDIANGIPSLDSSLLRESIEQQDEIAEVNKDTQLVNEYNVTSTPTVMINEKVVEDPFDYEMIKSIIEEELQEHE
ncbi:DsbA family protein [Bacillus suaedae]|uniref:DsbA family protein n=1 Tax=Halalkalibacter suaedae TaxID=2822140 RepID=A0A940WQS0_9BACI|nr:DsbA family protein [Bacillus suaedae]MBP3950795.1 DsbA family protein [Bacillus suaedae]